MALGKIFDSLIGLGVVAGIFFIVYAKAVKNNPRIAEIMAKFNPGNIYEKTTTKPQLKEKMEQIYEERRRMI